MIRADLYKGAKRLSNFIDRDASPRKDDQGKFHFSMHALRIIPGLFTELARRKLIMLRDSRQLGLSCTVVTQRLPTLMRV